MKHIKNLFLLILSWHICCTAPQVSSLSDAEYDKITFEWSLKFADVAHRVKKQHFKIADLEKAWAKAIDAFLNQLDAHSRLLYQESYDAIMQSACGEFYGIGVIIDNTRKKDKILNIIETIPQGPADTAGLKALDKIVEVDEQPIEGLLTEEVIAKLKGPRHTKVQVKILRDNAQELLSFDITRDIVKETSSQSFYISPYDIYYISLTTFSSQAEQQIEQLLLNAQKKKPKGIILDLRNNSGGLFTAAIDIAGLFAPNKALVVMTKNKDNEVVEKYYTTRNPVQGLDSLPIIILTNNYTASSAEILAGFLKHLASSNSAGIPKLIFLIGTKTFGKGSVQEVIPLDDHTAIKITTALYYFPNDTTIQGIGIEPDFAVERCTPPTEQIQWFLKNYGRENALENSIKVSEASDKKNPPKKEAASWNERMIKSLQTDNQLREAISIINTLGQLQAVAPKLITSRADALAALKKIYIADEELHIQEVKTESK